ncbi:MAG: hypothetical protein NTZ15_09905 [Burkholderiales bacterium]|nr:hypothetical protein [Burkholderiales bacterium]
MRIRKQVPIAALAALSLYVPSQATPAEGPSQSCNAAPLVDATFRDAALRTFERLMVVAPGLPADGAIKVHHSAGHIDPQGADWHHVSAYQVNLAFLGALRVNPQLAPAAARWLQWQARHTTMTGSGQGVVFDYWVRADGLQESQCPPGMDPRTCPQVDAFDSTAASLLLMADAYAEYAPQPSMLEEPTMRAALEAAAGTLTLLTQPSGLSWAKPGHKVAYLMDAVEVAAGWRAWARLQTRVFHVPAAAQNSLATARRVDAAIQKYLWHAPSQTWRVSQDVGKPSFSRWYPDTVAQAWPLLWDDGSDPAAWAHAQAAWRQAAAQWTGTKSWSQRNVDPAGFWWPAVAVAAHCVAEDDAAKAWVARARAAWMRESAPFVWPFQIADLLWLFRLSAPVASDPFPSSVSFLNPLSR